MFKKFVSLPNHSIRLCVKGKITNRGVEYGLEIPAEYLFYGNEKAIQYIRRTLNGVNENMTKKSFRKFKIQWFKKKQKQNQKQKNLFPYLCFVFSDLSAIGR